MVNLDCEHIENLIPLYIDNMLSEKESSSVRKHIKRCSECSETYKLLKSAMETAASIPEIQVPEDFHNNLMENVRKEAAKKRISLAVLRRTAVGFAAAAAVVALSVTAHINLNENAVTQNPDDFVTPAPVQQTSVPPKNEVEAVASEDPTKPEDKKTEVKSNANTVSNDSKKETKISSKNTNQTETSETSEKTDSQSAFSLRDEGVSVARMEDHRKICVLIYESEYEKAEEILKELEKDENGYKLDESSSEVLSKLSELEGFASYTEQDEAIDCDYIVLK